MAIILSKLNINNYSETGSVQDYLRGRITEINTSESDDNTYFNIKIGDFIKIQSNEIDLPDIYKKLIKIQIKEIEEIKIMIEKVLFIK